MVRRLKIESKNIAKAAREALVDRKGTEIVIFDVRRSSVITDFFIVATGGSPPQLKAMAEAVRQKMGGMGCENRRQTGDPSSGWIVLDCLDVVVHLFLPAQREYYALEELWDRHPRMLPV